MDFSGRIGRALARTLTRAPFAVAYSGGGDSTALLHTLRDRAAFAVIVDHGLSEGSEARTREAVSRASAMGVKVVRRDWSDLARTAQQAAAREARYSLIGEVLRARGVTQLLTGHTLTDAVETEMMSAGASSLRPVVHAPVWPGLEGIDIVRPMLTLTRDEVRDMLRREGLGYTDDPANQDMRFARVRARREITRDAEISWLAEFEDRREALWDEAVAWQHCLAVIQATATGGLDLPESTPPGLVRFAIACVAGEGRLPTLPPVEAAMARSGTLGGAVVLRRDDGWRLERDPGTVLGRDGVAPLPLIRLQSGKTVVWDGRFRITARADELTLAATGGKGRWRTLPRITDGSGEDAAALATVEPLALPRLRRMVSAQLRCG